jgi:outer membrane protein insertion porin family
VRALIAALLLLAPLLPLPAQEAPAPEAAPAVSPDWYIGKPIENVTFTGLAAVKLDQLEPIVKPYVGQPFTLDLFDKLQNAIVALDYFERVEGYARSPAGTYETVVVEFQVVERPAVSAVEIVGNHGVGRSDILDKVLLKKGDLYAEPKLRADEAAVRQLYLDKGYANIQVTGRAAPSGEGSVAVTFDIVEGPQTKIKEIRFSGNSWASASTLRGVMKTKAQGLFQSGDFLESRLEEDKQAIVQYYGEHGFVDAKVERVEQQVEASDGRNDLVLTVYIVEGVQWSYGGMTFEGNKVFSSPQLAALVHQKPGKVLNTRQVQEDFQRVVDLYTENGYVFNVIDRVESRDAERSTISYVVKITEYDKAHIEQIIFKGNTKTADFVLRRELPFQEGDVFNRTKLIEGYRNLANLQYFSNITPDFPPGLIDVVFSVEEGSTADINFGLMFSGQDFPVSGQIKWNERNFLGHGQTIGVDVELSPVKQLAALNFFEPWLGGRRWSAGLSLSVEHDSESDVLQDILPPVFSDADSIAGLAAPDPYASLAEYEAAYAAGETVPDQYLMSLNAFNITLAANTGYRLQTPAGWLGARGSLSSTFRYLTYDPALHRPFDITVRNNLDRFSIINSLSPTVYLDGRDFILNPTSGWYLSQGVSYTGGLLFGDRQFIRTDTALEGFLTLVNVPVTESWNFALILAAHTGLSLILPQYQIGGASGSGWHTVTDYTDLLYIDGMTVGRGWRQTYGKALWDNKLELRVPIARDVLTGVLFFDAAGLWPEISGSAPSLQTMSLEDLYYSFGIGLRFTIPQFPIRLYLGKGFQVKNGQVVWKPGDIGTDPTLSVSFIISLGGDVF